MWVALVGDGRFWSVAGGRAVWGGAGHYRSGWCTGSCPADRPLALAISAAAAAVECVQRSHFLGTANLVVADDSRGHAVAGRCGLLAQSQAGAKSGLAIRSLRSNSSIARISSLLNSTSSASRLAF